ncbi:YraN family protein [Ruania suaedae]|uniref:YraN family protein n=1 Tax=Ruania suaedae TaxID=2897774 RepID=UPI001E64883B|nr:YraN family protein [Ruania suaedae]UFU04154.1 YraN family protein [Ruania suaedae]
MVAMATKDEIGRAGEQLAAQWLAREGMEVLDRNWRCRFGEIDLVARDGEDLVVVEVKTRRTLTFGHPAEAVTTAKLTRLRRLAAHWVADHEVHAAGLRVDVLAIWCPAGAPVRVQHLRGVG